MMVAPTVASATSHSAHLLRFPVAPSSWTLAELTGSALFYIGAEEMFEA
jgi:hypothetical protein